MTGTTTTPSRRAKVRAAQLNGVDAVEVSDDGLLLTVGFLGKAPHGLGPENVRIDGGRRITGITAVDVSVEREEDPELDDRLYVTLDRAGDTSRYRLSLVETDPYGRPGTEPYRGFDQRYHSAAFAFRPDCPTPFDCKEDGHDAPEFPSAPVIDYTARDYDTIRKLLLDRLALTTPDWVERNPADLGVTLVELLAYTGDQISYQQDAVATEAYLDTARRRVSVRRHVRLIDYAMHDGCTARAYVAVETAGDHTLAPGTFRFASVDVRTLDPHDRPEPGTVVDEADLGDLDERGSVEVFEPVVTEDPLELRAAHNAIRLWTWGGEVCTLPKGATSATLRDEWVDQETCRDRRLDLRPGDLLVLEEVKGPRTGTPGDADPSHRQAVRLTSVTPAVDRIEDQPVLEITWVAEDALRFPLCLTTRGGRDCLPVEDVSLARGNVVLVDHGRTLHGLPETFTVPQVPAEVAPCDGPAFGCHDREEGNAPARLVNSLTDKAESGDALTADDVRELFEVVGEAATNRAGLGLERAGQRHERVVPGTAYAQAAALRTLLAQSVYPGIRPRFHPVLGRAPVTQAVPFPSRPPSPPDRPRGSARSRGGCGSGSSSCGAAPATGRPRRRGDRRAHGDLRTADPGAHRAAPPSRPSPARTAVPQRPAARRQAAPDRGPHGPRPRRHRPRRAHRLGDRPQLGSLLRGRAAPRGAGAAGLRDRRARAGPASRPARRTPARGRRRDLGTAPRPARQRPA